MQKLQDSKQSCAPTSEAAKSGKPGEVNHRQWCMVPQRPYTRIVMSLLSQNDEPLSLLVLP